MATDFSTWRGMFFLLRVDKKRQFFRKKKIRKGNNFESAGFGFQIQKDRSKDQCMEAKGR